VVLLVVFQKKKGDKRIGRSSERPNEGGGGRKDSARSPAQRTTTKFTPCCRRAENNVSGDFELLICGQRSLHEREGVKTEEYKKGEG